jgi:hypothetical protein
VKICHSIKPSISDTVDYLHIPFPLAFWSSFYGIIISILSGLSLSLRAFAAARTATKKKYARNCKHQQVAMLYLIQ